MPVIKRLAAMALAVVVSIGLVLPLGVGATSMESDFSSYSVEQLESLIAKLQRQLEDTKKGSLCFVSNNELSLGDGEDGELTDDVRRLQEFLKEKGHFSPKSTGYFGKFTRTSLMAFQKQQGLSQSGVFDGVTRQKAHAAYCRKVVQKKVSEEVKKVEKEKLASGVVKSLSLRASGRAVAWSVDGYSKSGFKVVWSRNPNPTYPNRDSDRYQYFESAMASEAKLEAFDGSGTYYVRVCEYLGGACGTYSNEVMVQLE